MLFLYGLLTAVVFFILCGGSFYLGFRLKQHPKVKPPDIDPEEKRRIEQYNKHFQALWSYDVPTALKRKKVHE